MKKVATARTKRNQATALLLTFQEKHPVSCLLTDWLLPESQATEKVFRANTLSGSGLLRRRYDAGLDRWRGLLDGGRDRRRNGLRLTVGRLTIGADGRVHKLCREDGLDHGCDLVGGSAGRSSPVARNVDQLGLGKRVCD